MRKSPKLSQPERDLIYDGNVDEDAPLGNAVAVKQYLCGRVLKEKAESYPICKECGTFIAVGAPRHTEESPMKTALSEEDCV